MKRTILSIVAMLCMTLALAQQKSHTIQRGETIESIAKKYNVSVYALERANPNAKEMFYVGMKLTIPEGGQSLNQNDPSALYEEQANNNNYEQNHSSRGSKEHDVLNGRWFYNLKLGYTSLMQTPKKGKSTTLDAGQLSMDVVYLLNKNWHVTAGLGYRFGYKNKKKVERQMMTLFLPVNIGYKIPLTEKTGLTFRAGPYADYAIDGYTKVEKKKTKFSKDKNYHELIFGAKASATVNFGKFGIYGEYGHGLTKRWKNSQESYWSVGLSYGF